MKIRLSVNLSPEVVDALKQLATKRNVTMTEALRQATGVQDQADTMNAPSFYIASSRDRIDEVRDLATMLCGHGMKNAFAWPDHFTHVCSMEQCGVRDRDHLAHLELVAAGGCDLFIGIARMGKGAHVELGAALMAGMARVVLVGVDPRDLVFYEARHVEHACDIPALLTMLGLDP